MSARKAVAIAGTNLRRLLKDRTGAFFVFVFPLLIILAIGAAFGSGFTPQLGVVSAGSGSLGADLRERLAATDGIELTPYPSIDAMRTAVERGRLEGGLVIPDGYDERVRAGETVPLDYVSRPGAEQELQLTVSAAIDAHGAAVRAARFAVEQGAAPGFEEAFAAASGLAAAAPSVEVATRTAGGDTEVGSFATGAAQELVLFMFLTSLSASSMLIETRRLGITRRMLASPTSARTVLLGEALGRYAIALVQGLLIVVGTVLLFQVDWGNLATTAIVVLLFALAGSGAAMLMGSVLRNAAQAGAMGVFLGLVLAALGGAMVPLEIFPPVMDRIAHLLPHAWAIEALTASITQGAGPADVATSLLVLAVYGAGLLGISSIVLRRTIVGHAGSS
jgi:ABC-2 type transport system permease protein